MDDCIPRSQHTDSVADKSRAGIGAWLYRTYDTKRGKFIECHSMVACIDFCNQVLHAGRFLDGKFYFLCLILDNSHAGFRNCHGGEFICKGTKCFFHSFQNFLPFIQGQLYISAVGSLCRCYCISHAGVNTAFHVIHYLLSH